MMLDENGKHSLDGYGGHVSEQLFNQGMYKKHKLHGQAKSVNIDGKIQEGHFKCDKLNGQGRRTFPDGTI